jgi:hypothetical protein
MWSDWQEAVVMITEKLDIRISTEILGRRFSSERRFRMLRQKKVFYDDTCISLSSGEKKVMATINIRGHGRETGGALVVDTYIYWR